MRVMESFFVALVGLSAAAVSALGQQYHGKLSSDLTIQKRYGHIEIKQASKVPPGLDLERGASVYAGSFSLSLEDEAHTQMRALVVNPPGGTPYVFVDDKRKGVFDQSTRVALTLDPDDKEDPSGPGEEIRYSGQTSLPIPIGMFKTYPIRLMVVMPKPAAKRTNAKTKAGSSSIELDFATSVNVYGTLDIDGKPVKVSYTLDPAKKKVDPYKEQLGVDCNLDGKISESYTSPEQADGYGEPVVFRVGSHYIATTAVDVVNGTITAEERPATEYRRIELSEGSRFPDFDFKDMAGKSHTSSQLRGKYVILDTWGTWCGSCREGMKWMKETLYPRFHSRGLEILSLDVEHPGGRELPKRDLLDKGKKEASEYLRKHDIPWLQADEESIYDLVMNRISVQRFPTVIVLDPEGKILGIDWEEKEMERRFGELLPDSGHAGI